MKYLIAILVAAVVAAVIVLLPGPPKPKYMPAPDQIARVHLIQVPYVAEQHELQTQQVQVAQAQPAAVAPGTTVQTTGDVSANTKISVGTLAGEALQSVLAVAAVPIGGFLAMILFRVLKGVGVNLDKAREDQLQESINRAVVMFGNAAPRMLDGKINVDVKNNVVRNAIEYVRAHRADTIKALGVDPNSKQAEEALTARAEVALADPEVPTPQVAPVIQQATSPAAPAAGGGQDLEAAIMRVLQGLRDRARTEAEEAARRPA
jgi:hypothetical protein